jgi:Na+-transporting NADH:ubiquinone oxidoreductase subunit F
MSPLLIGPLATGGIAAVLALIIALTDRVVNNYGEVEIDVNGGRKKLKVTGGEPLLASLAERGIFVPSACGGRGSCGACKTRVLSDVGPHLPTEIPYLSPQEAARNVRLACQVKLKRDIRIEIPDELFSVQRYTGWVEKIRDLTYDIKEVRVLLKNPGSIQYVPGQYAQLVVPPYDDVPESVQRAYSMSSRPGESDHVEFLIRLVPGGIATTWVHKHLAEGMDVQLVGPFGEFRVRDTPATMICVAGGSGMAPFWSILRDMRERNTFPGKEVWYFFGARTKGDMFFLDELLQLEKAMPRFHFVPALSEPKPEEGWQGEAGLITDVLDRYLAERVDAGKPREGYLCGSPGMINACIAVMTRHRIAPEDISYDKFA